MSDPSTENVKLTTLEGNVTSVPVKIISKSTLIKGLIEDAGTEDEIPIPNVKKEVLDKIIEYCTHIETNAPPEIEKPLRSAAISDVVSPWFASFIDLPQAELFDLILAANYLDIKSLLELSTAKVASIIKNKTIPEIRKYFNIENDFTPEEEMQIMEENKWAEESF